MEKGSAGVVWGENEGGSTRRKGEVEARRLESTPMRLCFGEPRLWAIGVEAAVFGDERALRMDGMAGEAVRGSALLTGAGEVKSENLEGFENPSDIFDFLVGELKREGSTFSESSSSNIAGPRWRLPVDAAGLGLSGDANLEFNSGVRAGGDAFSLHRSTREVDCLPFCLFFALWRAWRRGVPSSAKGWRVKKAMFGKCGSRKKATLQNSGRKVQARYVVYLREVGMEDGRGRGVT